MPDLSTLLQTCAAWKSWEVRHLGLSQIQNCFAEFVLHFAMRPVATAPTSLPKPAPAGSVEVRCPRQTSFPGNCLQVLCELLFTTYFFFWPVGTVVWLALPGACFQLESAAST
eukprot:s3968_g9.t1